MESEAILARLEQLETQNVRLARLVKIGSVGLLLMVVVMTAAFSRSTPPVSVLRVQSLEVVDGDGNPRIILDVDSATDAGLIEIRGSDQHRLIWIGASDFEDETEGTFVTSGRTGIMIDGGGDPFGTGNQEPAITIIEDLSLRASEGPMERIAVPSRSSAMLAVDGLAFPSAGIDSTVSYYGPTHMLIQNDSHSVGITPFNVSIGHVNGNRPVGYFGATSNGGTMLQLSDLAGQPRMQLATGGGTQAASELAIFDAEGDMLFNFGSDASGRIANYQRLTPSQEFERWFGRALTVLQVADTINQD